MCEHITVILKNNAGEFAGVAKLLMDYEVNILAFHVATTGANTGYAQLICNDQMKALVVLTGVYHTYAYASEVIAIRTKNVPGSLYEILSELLQAKVNIETAYQTLDDQGQAIIVIEPRGDDMERAKAAVADRHDLIQDFGSLRSIL